MSETEKQDRGAHRVSMQARANAEIRGVTEVVSFDEQIVSLETVCGGMTVSGDGLHISVLNVEEGLVALDGKIDSIEYEDTVASEGGKKRLFGRLMR